MCGVGRAPVAGINGVKLGEGESQEWFPQGESYQSGAELLEEGPCLLGSCESENGRKILLWGGDGRH